MQIEMERVTLERERQRIAEERLKALRQQRKKLEESIIKMSNEMSRDIDLATEDRKQGRINMENEYLNQIDLEEAAVDDFFPVLSRVEEIQPDVMTTDSQISSTVDPIEFRDEEALMKLKLKHMRADQCRTRTHKMYKLFLESATDPKKKKNLEHMLLATINNLERKMSKFKGGLDDYDQKEQYILAQSERLQNEQENKQRKAKIWREQRLEEERQKLKELERKRKEKGSLKVEEKENKKIREQQDRLLAERLIEIEKKAREIKDRNLAQQLQKRQRLEKDEQEKLLTEQLLEKERKEEEEMMRIKEEQEQLDREEQVRLEEERQFNLTEEQKRL